MKFKRRLQICWLEPHIPFRKLSKNTAYSDLHGKPAVLSSDIIWWYVWYYEPDSRFGLVNYELFNQTTQVLQFYSCTVSQDEEYTGETVLSSNTTLYLKKENKIKNPTLRQ